MSNQRSEKIDVLERLDEAAVALLEKAKVGDSFAELIEAFKTVATYATARAKIEPPATPKPKRGKFAKLKDGFNGAAPRGRGASAARGEAEADAGSADEGGDLVS